MTLSYVVAAAAALLSALCYAEMAVALPVAGGAFNYIAVSFGELPAFLVAWNMCGRVGSVCCCAEALPQTAAALGRCR